MLPGALRLPLPQTLDLFESDETWPREHRQCGCGHTARNGTWRRVESRCVDFNRPVPHPNDDAKGSPGGGVEKFGVVSRNGRLAAQYPYDPGNDVRETGKQVVPDQIARNRHVRVRGVLPERDASLNDERAHLAA